MRKPTTLDWIGAVAAWGFISAGFGAFLHMGVLLPEELATVIGFGSFFGGIVTARVWWLRRPENAPVGLTTGEAQMTRLEEVETRLAEMEALQDRVAELEDRLDFSERLLASSGQRPPLERRDG